MLTEDLRMVVIGGAKRAARIYASDEIASDRTVAYAVAVAGEQMSLAAARWGEEFDPDRWSIRGSLTSQPDGLGPMILRVTIEPLGDST